MKITTKMKIIMKIIMKITITMKITMTKRQSGLERPKLIKAHYRIGEPWAAHLSMGPLIDPKEGCHQKEHHCIHACQY
jgi:hypothetical protein